MGEDYWFLVGAILLLLAWARSMTGPWLFARCLICGRRDFVWRLRRVYHACHAANAEPDAWDYHLEHRHC